MVVVPAEWLGRWLGPMRAPLLKSAKYPAHIYSKASLDSPLQSVRICDHNMTKWIPALPSKVHDD